jgi:hypothetical protein
MKKTYVAAFAVGLCLLVAVATAQSVSRDAQDRDRYPDDRYADEVDEERPASRAALDFDYQFGIVEPNGDARYVSRIAALGSGERFTVRLRSRASAYAYLFVSNAEGGFSLVAPEGNDRDEERAGTPTSGQRWVTLPDERAVMRLDDRRGIERVYVVVANRRVPEIERLIDDRDPEVSESWLIALRNRGARARWTRQYTETYVRANGSLALAVEDASFAHR